MCRTQAHRQSLGLQKPIYNELAAEYKGKVLFYLVDSEKENELLNVCGIKAVPTIFFIPMNAIPQTLASADKEKLQNTIDSVLLGISKSSDNGTFETEEGNKAYRNKDYAKAREWYTKSLENGNEGAKVGIAEVDKLIAEKQNDEMYEFQEEQNAYLNKDYVKAMQWLMTTAEKGNDKAMLNV